MITIVAIVGAFVGGFVFGVLFGRKNKNKVEQAVNAYETAEKKITGK